jgi:hypothetical protein
MDVEISRIVAIVPMVNNVALSLLTFVVRFIYRCNRNSNMTLGYNLTEESHISESDFSSIKSFTEDSTVEISTSTPIEETKDEVHTFATIEGSTDEISTSTLTEEARRKYPLLLKKAQ